MELTIRTWKSPDGNTVIQISSDNKQFNVYYNKELDEFSTSHQKEENEVKYFKCLNNK